MTRINRTAAVLIAAALAPLAFNPAIAASDHAKGQPACTQSDTVNGVDCTITNSTGERDLRQAPKASQYPDGPVNMGGGVWF